MGKDLVSAVMELESGEEVNIDGYVYFHTENNYGADADGNRGVKQVFVDEVKEVSAYRNDEQIELNLNEKERAEETLTRAFIEG